jgi:hypothetical protein
MSPNNQVFESDHRSGGPRQGSACCYRDRLSGAHDSLRQQRKRRTIPQQRRPVVRTSAPLDLQIRRNTVFVTPAIGARNSGKLSDIC